tara:strand:+ start:2530 stop:3108 length:579 start_codon:yes stop_codon:yes gene_type:complete
MKTFLDLREARTATLSMSQKAIRFAANAHRKQSRASGKPYISHPVEVGKIVKQFKTSHNIDALIAAAYLHDTIEDTNATYEDLVKMFGGLIANIVKELTSEESGADYKQKGKTQYLKDKMTNMSDWALVVKLADRLHNVSDLGSKGGKGDEWGRKYKSQTQSILSELEKSRTLTSTQKKIVKAIRKKMDEFE